MRAVHRLVAGGATMVMVALGMVAAGDVVAAAPTGSIGMVDAGGDVNAKPSAVRDPAPVASVPAPVVTDPRPDMGSRLVVFGDSLVAGTNLMVAQDERECYQGENAWPKHVAESMGVLGTADYVDASCWGAVIDTGDNWPLADQARWADARGAFGSRTELVLIGLGMNDSWGNDVDGLLPAIENCAFDFVRGCGRDAPAQLRTPDPAALTGDAYAARIEQVITYIKYYAPHARIALIGYPEMTAQRGDELCVSAFGLPIVQPRGGALVDYFAAMVIAQRDAAQKLGLEFVDVRTAFSGHGPCAPDPWVHGLLDFRELLGVPMHLTRQGEVVLAGQVSQQLGL